MTREKAIKSLQFVRNALDDSMDIATDYDIAIKALEQEPCDDAISRQAVLDKKELVDLEDGQSFYCISPEDVETLPPVTPQPKIGRWVENDRGICSCCGKYKYEGIDGSIYDDAWFPSYCPNCGEKMVEPQESEDKR